MTESVTIPEHKLGSWGPALRVLSPNSSPESRWLLRGRRGGVDLESRVLGGTQASAGHPPSLWQNKFRPRVECGDDGGSGGYLKPDLLIRGVCVLSDSFLVLMCCAGWCVWGLFSYRSLV